MEKTLKTLWICFSRSALMITLLNCFVKRRQSKKKKKEAKHVKKRKRIIINTRGMEYCVITLSNTEKRRHNMWMCGIFFLDFSLNKKATHVSLHFALPCPAFVKSQAILLQDPKSLGTYFIFYFLLRIWWRNDEGERRHDMTNCCNDTRRCHESHTIHQCDPCMTWALQ